MYQGPVANQKEGEINAFHVPLLLAGATWNKLKGKPNPEAELDPLASRVSGLQDGQK